MDSWTLNVLYHVILDHAILHYTILYYTTLYYIILYYIGACLGGFFKQDQTRAWGSVVHTSALLTLSDNHAGK